MTLPSDALTGGLAFHRLVFARRRSGWWTPLATGLLALAFYLAFQVVVVVATVLAAFADPGILDRFQAMALAPTFDLTDPFLVSFLLGVIALMLPAYVLASLIVNGRRVGLISSAAGRLRWRWMLLCAAAAAVIAVVLTGLSLLFPAEGTPLAPRENPLWAVTLVIVLLLVPLQSAAEEYIFRGYLMQTIGRWLRHPAFAILLPVPLFVVGHLYDVYGQVGVALFAVAAGWLTWRTGGLEAAIALHVVNNLVGFLSGLASGADPTATDQGPLSMLWSVVLIGGYVAVVEVLFRRSRMPRTLVLTLPAPSPFDQTSPVQIPAGRQR
ncbi:type II CAAX endopeptidase family protein [Microbacterium sp.]|uniref:CPBP family intramembrane glutamic endopeptidase n=1 Tax=Microbacterium sp. TaxID=51671 RepID=UPI0025DBF8BF|nr:type II CAAX endopeptidase family protein [Microbacterium sp.]